MFLLTIVLILWVQRGSHIELETRSRSVVKFLLTFWPEISTLGGVCDDAFGWEKGKSDFWVKLKKCCGFGYCPNCQGFKTLRTWPEYSKTSWGRVMSHTVSYILWHLFGSCYLLCSYTMYTQDKYIICLSQTAHLYAEAVLTGRLQSESLTEGLALGRCETRRSWVTLS